ncbi:Syntaxin-81 [Chlorella sorokiniana]|uniref:Syntaxin-81 n=1 Tax=Chlorella sorokiniana TaxID=3076 RepID=A0A2P6TCV1_CHLSO|nr:Syntaxin-81 [Chlorella sorokiniana]|eukprot:PRW20462.1 Syntaxin-81 [Chlorella sorokiniana]
MDQTPLYWEAVLAAARQQQWPEDALTKLRQRQILRSLANRAPFTKAAIEVAHNVAALRAFLRDSQREYAQLGRLPEAERDRIEEEIGAAVRSCAANIDTLQQMLAAGAVGAGAPAKQPPSADLMAHRQGQVLILSERLRAATALFDRLRSLRYQQLQQQEAARLRRLPQRQEGSAAPQPMTSGQLHQRLQQGAAAAAGAQQQQAWQPGGQGPGGAGSSGPVQQQIQMENQALQLELLGMNEQVQHAERTVREIATLNQMFSGAIMAQSEQIEKLYADAVDATHNISRANVQLDKAIRTNRSARKYMIVFFLVASLALLFLDWWNS